jgi:SAM-dependent methyltransferase
LGVLLCWVLAYLVLILGRRATLHRRWDWLVDALMLLVVGGIAYFAFRQIQNTMAGVIEVQRNFYGVFRVRVLSTGEPPAEYLSLSHGITTHGNQFSDPAKRRTPTTYYGRNSGIGLALTHYPEVQEQNPHPAGLRVGIVGLGAGTLAAYGNPGDYYRFYEINPDIIALALGKNERFTYLQDTPADFDIVSGDARLSMEYELDRGQPQNFDILAVDAFSSDSIPVHLLTAEAFEIYLRHLAPKGVLAIHISNRYLDLAPLVRAQGERAGLEMALVSNPSNNEGVYASTWVLLSRDRSLFELPQIKDVTRPFPDTPNPIRLWTDDYSNLLQFLRMGNFYNIR